MSYNLSVNAQDILCVSGTIDLTNVVDACAKGRELINGLSKVTIDLSGLQQSDSSCLAMLVDWIRCAKAQNKDVIITHMPRKMLDLGRVCGLDAILPLDKTLKFN